MPSNTKTKSNGEPSPISMHLWNDRQKSQIGIESDSEGSDHNRRLLETSRRSMSSKTAAGTCATTGSDSLALPSDSKRKKKKDKKKSKKSKTKKDKDKGKESDKKKKTRRKEMVTMDDDNHSTVTEGDEKLVDELCTFLSNTLSSGNKTESFLRLLSENSAQGTVDAIPEQNDGGQYNSLQSPEPSVCGSYTSHFTTLSSLRSDRVQNKSWWTAVDAPSITSGVTANRSNLSHSQRQPSIRGPLQKPSREPTMGSVELMTPLSAIACSLKGAGHRHPNPSSVAVAGPKPEKRSNSVSPRRNRNTIAFPDRSMSERRMDSASRPKMPGSDEATPEDLILALPQEFRLYLLSLQQEELANAPSSKNVKGRNETFLMSCENPSIPSETRGDRDALSVVSELSALTGLVSYATKPMLYSPDGDFLARDSIDDSSGESDDSDNESQSSGADLKNSPSLVSHHHVHNRMPRRSSLSSSPGMVRQELPRGVRFESVHIREFDTVLDCNPAVSEGPAIALGWRVISEATFLLNDKDDDRHRRYGDALMLSTHTREGILLRFGYSPTDIDSAVRRIQRAQNQRRRTAQKVRMHSLEFAMERVGKRFRHLLSGGGNTSKSKV